MTIYRATVLDTPNSPFVGGTLRADDDAGILVQHGVIGARGAIAEVARAHPHDKSADRGALPEEAVPAATLFAHSGAAEFVSGLVAAGTTSALVFGSHFASAVD